MVRYRESEAWVHVPSLKSYVLLDELPHFSVFVSASVKWALG